MKASSWIFAILAVAFAGCAEAEGQATIHWKKDYIPGPDGGPMAVVKPQPSDTTAPSTPMGVTLTGTSSVSASLSWSPSTDTGGSGLAGYRVFRGVTIVGVVNTTHFTDVTLKPSTAYEFKIAAFDVAGNQSGLSSGVNTPGAMPPNPPGTLVATAAGTSQVNLAWSAPSGSIDHYEVWRRTTGSYSKIAEPSGTSYSDTSISANTAYVYKVLAVNGNGASGDSNADVATTVVFTDPTITVNVTLVKAVHVAELRQAVDYVRTAAGLSGASWTDSSLSGIAVKAVHVTELRSNLAAALSALGVSAPTYTDSTITAETTVIKKAHVDDLRAAVR